MPEATTREILDRLIGFDTTSRNSNLPLIAFAEAWLKQHGVPCRRVYDATGTKANLFATIGPDRPDGIILSGHVDTVPVDGQSWSTDPFSVVEHDGRLFGRGTADMKGFCAVVLARVPAMVQSGLERPIHIALSYDEEVGCIGVQDLLHALADEGFKAAGCVVGEPSSMEVILGHKGKHSYEVRLRGKECHSALAPEGVNAVEYAARLITKISDIGRSLQSEGPFDAAYTVPHTTAHVGTCQGGTALNIVPNACSLLYEFRHLVQQPAEPLIAEVEAFARDALEPAMRAVDPSTGIDFRLISNIPGFDIPDDHPFVRFVATLAGTSIGGKVAYGTEGGLFAGILDLPVVICGPGDIEQAHKPDEFVEVLQLEQCERFVDGLIRTLAAAPGAAADAA